MNVKEFINLIDGGVISGVTSDSRRVQQGYLFAALPGNKVRGEDYIEDAIAHGAKYILVSNEADGLEKNSQNTQFIKSDNVRFDFARIVSKFYKIQPQNIVAVTGTSGKTSVVSFIQQLWHLSGTKKCASLGTLGIRGPGIREDGRLTTPDTETLHAELADLSSVGIQHVAIEASSHGLDQYRLDGLDIKCAAFTNLSRDHLDYHKDLESYFKAKARLFHEVLREDGVAVLNADDEFFEPLQKICVQRNIQFLSFGNDGKELKILSRIPKDYGQDVHIVIQGKEYQIKLPLVGEFQAMNALCALGCVLALDNSADKYIPLLEKLRGVAGRLELVPGHAQGSVYVDYAHKPGALESVLKTLRPHTSERLICLFGCGGNRDTGKRQIMGEVAESLADKVIVTDDNPRYEDPESIRADILKGAKNAIEIGDRAEAIQKTVKNMKAGDVLVVAGKGHEKGQIINGKVHPFNDVEEVRKAIENL